MTATPPLYQIAIPAPLYRLFDYLPPRDWNGEVLEPGTRVLVPFGRRQVVGILMEEASHTGIPTDRLRPILRALDHGSLLAPADLRLLRWTADYYCHPIGEVMAAAFPTALRLARGAEEASRHCALTEAGRSTVPENLKRAPRQQELLAWLQQKAGPASTEELDELIWDWRGAAKSLQDKGYLAWVEVPATFGEPAPPAVIKPDPELNPEQRHATAAVAEALGGFQPFLLEGVTGSGKTEVYIRLIRQVLERGQQVLVLLPEIALTPQLEARFRERFSVPVGVFHSGLSQGRRLRTWFGAQRGMLPVLLGTRSAVFTPLPKLGLIVVDEEHDASFKQQDGFRFHARDVAVMRARLADVPIVLGSATPSLESAYNVQRDRYRHLALPQRAGGAQPPVVRLLDLRGQRLDAGLSVALQDAITQTRRQDGQVLLFLNRRGYAPVLLCHSCAWTAQCRRCDANLVLHARARRLRCHHCGADQSVPVACPSCGSDDLRPLGQGTERVEQALRRLFPETGMARIDRDSTRRKGELERILRDVRAGRVQLLLGTQMLAKGHDFPNVTLVGILDVDGGLFSVDFRAPERLAQLVVQVAGRAGRGDKPGLVLLQTHQPEHPLLQTLLTQGYAGFSRDALAERRAAGLPPFSHQALLRAEATDAEAPRAFLTQLALWARSRTDDILLLGPAPAPHERLAGRYRWQLLLQASRRGALHRSLRQLVAQLEKTPPSSRVRWSLDVDPADQY